MPVKGVHLVVYDKDGDVKDTYPLTQLKSADGKAINTWSVNIPYTPPDDSPYKEMQSGVKSGLMRRLPMKTGG